VILLSVRRKRDPVEVMEMLPPSATVADVVVVLLLMTSASLKTSLTFPARAAAVPELLAEIVEIYSNYDWQTEVLAASIRHPIHVIAAARMGAHVATMPFKVIEQLIKHPLTDKGLEQFLSDWHKSKH